jgi:hypothetical protein
VDEPKSVAKKSK